LTQIIAGRRENREGARVIADSQGASAQRTKELVDGEKRNVKAGQPLRRD
tara:strand:- start:1336 stop:1485 length:150 start_codon:yes stop_codon:yes gene_type:complete